MFTPHSSCQGALKSYLITQRTCSICMGLPTNLVRLGLLLLVLVSSASSMAEEGAAGVPKQEEEAAAVPKEEEAAVHIVFVQKPDHVEVEPEVHHVRTLASVLGSEEAAKEALIYSYTTAASGFAAKLTPQQAEEMARHPDVLQVQPDEVLQLASGPAGFSVM